MINDFKLDKIDVLDMSVNLEINENGIGSTFAIGINSYIQDMLTDTDLKRVNDNLREIANIVNKVVVDDVAADIAKIMLEVEDDNDFSPVKFSDFIEAINKDKELKSALDIVMNALDEMR